MFSATTLTMQSGEHSPLCKAILGKILNLEQLSLVHIGQNNVKRFPGCRAKPLTNE